MELVKTSNPTFRSSIYTNLGHVAYGDAMTVNGTISKTGILLLCLMGTALYTWSQFFRGDRDASAVGVEIMVGVFGGLIFALITSFKMQWAPVTAPIYALFEGLFLGGISAIFEAMHPGIAIQAVALTFATLLCLLMAYRAGWVRATQKFTMGVVAATGGICLVYFASMILGFFHVQIPGIFGAGPVGILFSLFVVTIAALNLVLDFNFIEQGAMRGAPKYMEWYGAFGLMVTLVWLYLEILRLLSKLQDRR